MIDLLHSLLTSALTPACSVCFGDPEAPLSKGLTMGVVALVGVTGLVLSGFVYFFIRLAQRARSVGSPIDAISHQEPQGQLHDQTAQPQPTKEQPC